MIEIHYAPIGNPVNDFHLDSEIESIKETIREWSEGFRIWYSTENIFTRIRYEIVSGNIDEKDIVFVFNDEILPVNRFGAIMNWPNGFCDVNINLSESILRKALAKKKSER